MKKLYLLILAVCGLTVCTGDLDQQPQTDSQTTADVVYGSEEGYKMALAKLYASYVIVGRNREVAMPIFRAITVTTSCAAISTFRNAPLTK